MELTGIYKQMVEAWVKPIVIREDEELKKFSFGLLKSRRYLANLDSRGEGPESKQQSGGRVFYDASDLAYWLQEKCTPKSKRQWVVGDKDGISYIEPPKALEDVSEAYTLVIDSDGNIRRSATLLTGE